VRYTLIPDENGALRLNLAPIESVLESDLRVRNG